MITEPWEKEAIDLAAKKIARLHNAMDQAVRDLAMQILVDRYQVELTTIRARVTDEIEFRTNIKLCRV